MMEVLLDLSSDDEDQKRPSPKHIEQQPERGAPILPPRKDRFYAWDFASDDGRTDETEDQLEERLEMSHNSAERTISSMT
jgi:hypothetical protein